MRSGYEKQLDAKRPKKSRGHLDKLGDRDLLFQNRGLLRETLADGLGLLLVARLVQESEHILLVGLNTRLVERIDSQGVSAYAAGELEEIEEAAEIVLVDLLHLYLKLRNIAVDMSQLGTELSHSVAILHILACEVVKLVEILLVAANLDAAAALLHRKNGLEHHAVTLLDELAHRMKVSGIGN